MPTHQMRNVHIRKTLTVLGGALVFSVCAQTDLSVRSAQAQTTATPWYSSNGTKLGPLHAPIRGLTIGPIENTRHPDRGYGSRVYDRTLYESKQMGATWVSLTPFGRVQDLKATGIDMSFEAPFQKNKDDITKAIAQAHSHGLKVLLVPHLWVESGEWRALINPETNEGWQKFADSYQHFVTQWAEVAQKAGADLFSVGVEQRSWVTTARAPLYDNVIRSVRQVYKGPITYSANWDDVDDSVILGQIDIIGINAFYPLADKEGARFQRLLGGGKQIADKVRSLANRWGKPVLFTEIGYTTRTDPAIKPWEWPDSMKDVKIDELAQAEAYEALIAPLIDLPEFAGFFVWRLYADPDDVSQEAEWGFSPRRKLAELVVRDAFIAHWASDPDYEPGNVPARIGSDWPGLYDGPTRPAWWTIR